MVRNRLFFISRLGYHDSHLRARKEAVEYVEMRNRLESLLDYAEESDESRDPEGDDRESGHYMREFEKIGIRLIQTPNELQGARFTAKGVVRGEQSEELLNMARSTPADSSGIKIISIPNAIEAVKADPDLEISLRLFLKLSEAMRLYTSRFYNQTSFYTKETKIVCREPPDSDLEKEANTEISCFPQEDGSCVDPEEKAPVGMEVNEYTGVMFINNVMEGGETVFLNRIYKPVAQVSPKRGLFTVFEASDRHTVSPSASQRCVILMTFAPEKVKDNPEYRQAMAFLNELDEERVKKLHIDNVKRVEELEKEGVTIVQSGKELQGDERFVADGLMNKGDCQNLVSLLEAGGIEGDGYQGKSSPLSQHEVFTGLTSEKANQSAGIAGDGYKGKPEIVVSKISPHTKHEIFEGLTVGRATQLAHSGELPKDTVQLYLDVSERARLLVENFFNLTRPLYFDFTHLVCRKAITDDKGDEEERSDLSHPVHADNCLLQADGTCLRQFPAYIARDYSAVLYLNGNEDFEGGEFFFAHGNKTEQASVSPKCGRMVGFNAGDFHGVRAVRKGRRCAVAMWYTMDPNTQELARVQAQKKMALGSAVQDRTRERGGAKAGKDEEKGEENGAHHENSDVDDDKIHKHKDHLDQSENTEISEETQKQTDRVTMENEEHEEL
ncbi:prolyl 3-hydroxylase 1-like isoform X5 [Ostrea edulis]|nr:prolyl 3-hydroxylase 1-like isoform X5 [Ostrea edulis]XP_055995334.1 prolyl 3-hydroxylase 1-like isoform X5 [Ostrea edulis]